MWYLVLSLFWCFILLANERAHYLISKKRIDSKKEEISTQKESRPLTNKPSRKNPYPSMSFERFMSLYNVNPKRWKICEEERAYCAFTLHYSNDENRISMFCLTSYEDDSKLAEWIKERRKIAIENERAASLKKLSESVMRDLAFQKTNKDSYIPSLILPFDYETPTKIKGRSIDDEIQELEEIISREETLMSNRDRAAY